MHIFSKRLWVQISKGRMDMILLSSYERVQEFLVQRNTPVQILQEINLCCWLFVRACSCSFVLSYLFMKHILNDYYMSRPQALGKKGLTWFLLKNR